MAGNKRSGRSAKSAARHRLEGTFRGDRHDAAEAAESMSGGELPRRPVGLTGEARKLWGVIVLPLVRLAGAGEIDVPALRGMCRWFALWVEADKRLKQSARLIDRRSTEPAELAAYIALNRETAKLAAMYWDKFERMAARFGMTPADRQRLRPPEEEREKDPMERLLEEHFAGKG